MAACSLSERAGCSRISRRRSSRSGGPAPKVLITGESGVGKEVVARAIAAASPRPGAPFIPVNCAGIPETLLESELFGHVKGSFTGAYRDKPGKLEMAIERHDLPRRNRRDDAPHAGPAAALPRDRRNPEGRRRARRNGAERPGHCGNKSRSARARRQGQFREDLFYRINVIHLVVPPLRERREDIPALIDHFLTNFMTARPVTRMATATESHGERPRTDGRARHLARGRVDARRATRGPATCASSRTCSNGSSSPVAAR